MNADDFRRLALGMNDVVEGAHMGHADFRVNGRVFASLHDDPTWAMVKLTPEQQQRFVREAPAAFRPENGAWGTRGYTAVRLSETDAEVLGEAITLAWQNAAAARGAVRRSRSRPRLNRRRA